MARKNLFGKITQGHIIALIGVVLMVVFSVTLSGFLTYSNIFSLLQSVAIIGILGLGMAITVIGRGIDLTMIALAVMPVAWSFMLIGQGAPVGLAIFGAIFITFCIGLLNGLLIAYVEVPALFATLANGIIVYGGMQYLGGLNNDLFSVPPQIEGLAASMRGTFLGIPNGVLLFFGTAFLIYLFLRFVVAGRYIYAIGDNTDAARITGVPVRPILVLQYVLSALIALMAGYVLSFSLDGANTRLFNSTMIYDVILVVVLGGIGLSGGRGGVANVLAGTVLIGILTNAMTIMNMEYFYQNLVKAGILLGAIIADSMINIRDEQTSQQGDI